MEETVSFSSPSGRIVYRDSRDHFENGVLRLLHLDQRSFTAWLAVADEALAGSNDIVDALGRAYQEMNDIAGPPPMVPSVVEDGPSGERGSIWQPRIAQSPAFGLARSGNGYLGWLVKPSANGWRREREPPSYEEAYFEGDPAIGYGDYAAQGNWRLEKARRQVRELGQVAELTSGARALDIGSGYGFFRRALEEAGIAHEGLEISAHARAMARRLYAYETFAGSLAEHRDEWRDRYDLITLWDVLEHVPDPRDFLAAIAICLRPGGLLAIKTPNLDCPEVEIFGPHYHSFKREHLVYFTAAELCAAAGEQGLELVRISSLSHLLVGFVGASRTAEWEAALRGAALLAYFRKRRASSLRGSRESV